MEVIPNFTEQEKKEEVVHYMEKFADLEMAGEYISRVNEIADIIEEDPKAVEFLNGLLEDVGHYAHRVYKTETQSRFLKFKLEGKDLHSAVENIDRSQRSAHNRLIDDIRIFNRYIFTHFENVPENGIAPLPREALQNEDRDEIAKWAFSLFMGYLSQRE